jgi:hypothetical protein
VLNYDLGVGAGVTNPYTGTSTTTSSTLTANTNYCYTVTGRDSASNLGTASAQGCQYTLAVKPSITSVVCSGTTGAFQCSVTFNMNGNPAGTNYYITASSSDSGTGFDSSGWVSAASPYVDTGLQAHKTYCYKIKARNSATTPVETTETMTTCTQVPNNAPITPTTLTPSTAVVKGGIIPTASIACSGSTDADSDTIYYDIESYYDASWHVLSDNDADGNYAWNVGGIATQAGVDIRCRATDTIVDSSYKTNNDVITIDNTAPTPNPETIASVTADSTTQLTVAATAGTEPYSTPVSYQLDETSANPGGSDFAWQTSASFADNGLSTNVQYCYKAQMKDY